MYWGKTERGWEEVKEQTGQEQEWNRKGSGMEREGNRNGTGMEQEWNRKHTGVLMMHLNYETA